MNESTISEPMSSGGQLRTIAISKPSIEFGVILGTLHYSEYTIKLIAQLFRSSEQGTKKIEWGAACLEAGLDPKIHLAASSETMKQLIEQNARALRTSHSFIVLFRGLWPMEILPQLRALPTICAIKGASNEAGAVIVLSVSEPMTQDSRTNPPTIHTMIGYQDGAIFETRIEERKLHSGGI